MGYIHAWMHRWLITLHHVPAMCNGKFRWRCGQVFLGCGGGVWPAEPRAQRPRLRERIVCTRDEPDTRPAAQRTHHWAVGAQSTHRTFVERCWQRGDGGNLQRTVQSGASSIQANITVCFGRWRHLEIKRLASDWSGEWWAHAHAILRSSALARPSLLTSEHWQSLFFVLHSYYYLNYFELVWTRHLRYGYRRW